MFNDKAKISAFYQLFMLVAARMCIILCVLHMFYMGLEAECGAR